MRRRKPRGGGTKLAEALPSVTEAYIKFVAESDHDADPKAFAARHSAAKTALSHIEQLLKLSSDDEEAAGFDPAAMALGAARDEMAGEACGEIGEEEGETPTNDPGEPS
ncbi:MAG: hypothetical protein WCP77_10515 [Roseococcus sp.]